ncbi:MAG: TIR domain-containing protein [Pyrinomonadaceae bacterium]
MKMTPSTMSPLEAYEALMLFARRRGEGALRLAMHAAVPQSFRPDLLHLLKLNFLPRELHDAAAEADVLFSPLCEEVGRGYFEFGPHVRTLLLDNLAANYAADRTPRIERVANFLLHYVEQMERRAAGGLDRLWRDYLEVQRWVALAFLDPDAAARQLAAALKGISTPGGEFAARLRLGGLATALSSPLVKYRHVLNYAAGLQALEAGDHARARTLLSGLGDEELDVGGVRLRPASDLLRAYSVQSPEPAPNPEIVPTPEPSHLPAAKPQLFLSYAREDWPRVEKIYSVLQEKGYETRFDISLSPTERWDEAVRVAMERADFFIFFLSQNPSNERVQRRAVIDYALMRAADRSKSDVFIIPALLEPCEFPQALARYQHVDLSAEGGWAEFEAAIELGLERLRSSGAMSGEFEEKVRALEALAGSDSPGALETLTEAVWTEKDGRVRLAAVNALSKNRSEAALETLLFAAGDEDAEVRRVAAEALAAAEVNAVLIFGFFGTDHVENREVLREELRRRGYDPLVFPYPLPYRSNPAEATHVAAPLARFAIADLTAPAQIQEDIGRLLEIFLSQTGLPLLPIHQGVMLSKLPVELREKYPSVLPIHSYSGPGELREAFDRIVTEPVAAKRREMSGRSEAGEQPPATDMAEVQWQESLPLFANDVLISYAHLDNMPLPESNQGWVDIFQDQLRVKLSQILGREPVIWWEKRPAGDELFENSINDRLFDTLLLVVVFSPAYVRSEWCLRELRAFTKSAERHGGLRPGGRSRIFKVVTTPAEGGPEELHELVGYKFFEDDEPGGMPREVSPDVTPGSPEYRDKLDLLAWDIGQTLAELKYVPKRGGPAEAA